LAFTKESRAGNFMADAQTVLIAVQSPALPATKHQNRSPDAMWVSLIAVVAGLWVMVFAAEAGRMSWSVADLLFWVAFTLLVAPVAVRVILPKTSRHERIVLLVAEGLALFLVKVFEYPLYVTYFDEFLHWRTALDIAATQHLFTPNALLPVSPLYPGLEIATNALSSVSGLSIFASGVLVDGAARVIGILAIYLFIELLSGSSHVAGIAVLLYLSSPHVLFFDAQYAYETVAIPLAALTLYALLATVRSTQRARIGALVVAWLCLGAVVLTHHVTSFILIGFIGLWGIIALFRRTTRTEGILASLTALLGIQCVILWLVYVGTQVLGYLSPYLAASVQETTKLIAREQSTRPLFTDSTGQVAPLWERIVATGTTAVLLGLLPLGLWMIWRNHRREPLPLALALASLLYPVSVALRLTSVGGELASRISTLLYIPLAYVVARGLTEFRPQIVVAWVKRTNRPFLVRWMQSLRAARPAALAAFPTLIVVGVTFVTIGGAISGGGPMWARLPGPYLVGSDTRSIDPEGIAAATWAGTFLGPTNRVGADRINEVLMGTFGDQRVVTEINDNVRVSTLFFAPTLDVGSLAVLRQGHIHYVVADRRLSTALPGFGQYFDTGDPQQPDGRPVQITLAELDKFNGVYPISHLYDSGDIEIYDVGVLSGGS
jgi:hypothetical protein